MIDDLAPGGDGVGHAVFEGERRAVFVRRVAVGDKVELDVDRSVRPARGRVLSRLEDGPGRVGSPCAFASECGACDWIHLSHPTQRRAREDHLRRALPAAFRDFPIVIHDASESLGYRTRARLHLRASGGRAVVGFHAAGTNDIVEVSTCIVLHPALDAARARVNALFEGAHGEGEVNLALGEGGKPVFELRWRGTVAAASFGRIERGVAEGAWAGGALYVGDVRRPAVVGNPSPQTTGADGRPLRLAPGGFAQPSDTASVALGLRVASLARDAMLTAASREPRGADRSVVELYAGAGNFTVLLAAAPELGRVVAVESNAEACEAARRNLSARALGAKVTCADADDYAVPPRTDLVVLDPPRRGAKKACNALASSTVKAIVYVSCDPPTLGRDLALLAPRFEPFAIESFAMFPGTSHSETVVALRRRRVVPTAPGAPRGTVPSSDP